MLTLEETIAAIKMDEALGKPASWDHDHQFGIEAWERREGAYAPKPLAASKPKPGEPYLMLMQRSDGSDYIVRVMYKPVRRER